ncbi:type II toxin-antitoxin system RelE/ParE family toxin [Telmatobacter bradus]|uniref:type II toxin-antitoxin system RelE/ParE family toxin n=1 Tax=Telmatobacter bradus TaxID=474953 RepID=UPI003B43B3F8
MIRSFRYPGIERFFRTGSKAGIIPAHAEKLAYRLQVLDFAKSPEDMNMPGWSLHKLTGDLQGHWSVKVSGNWRLIFTFAEQDAILVDYQDYH